MTQPPDQPELIEGARLTLRERLQLAAQRPLRRGDQTPPAGGLFDPEARQQGELF